MSDSMQCAIGPIIMVGAFLALFAFRFWQIKIRRLTCLSCKGKLKCVGTGHGYCYSKDIWECLECGSRFRGDYQSELKV